MTELIGGTLGKILNEDNHELYETIQNTEQWVVIQGEVIQDADLNYMRNVIGFVQALIETGAVGVFFSKPTKLHTHSGLTYIVNASHVADLDNPDFNNSYYHILWKDCSLVE